MKTKAFITHGNNRAFQLGFVPLIIQTPSFKPFLRPDQWRTEFIQQWSLIWTAFSGICPTSQCWLL